MERSDYFVTKMWISYYAEAIVGIALLFCMAALFMFIGAVLIGGFGDAGGFAWVAVCYAMCLGFDKVLVPVQGAVRSVVMAAVRGLPFSAPRRKIQ